MIHGHDHFQSKLCMMLIKYFCRQQLALANPNLLQNFLPEGHELFWICCVLSSLQAIIRCRNRKENQLWCDLRLSKPPWPQRWIQMIGNCKSWDYKGEKKKLLGGWMMMQIHSLCPWNLSCRSLKSQCSLSFKSKLSHFKHLNWRKDMKVVENSLMKWFFRLISLEKKVREI